MRSSYANKRSLFSTRNRLNVLSAEMCNKVLQGKLTILVCPLDSSVCLLMVSTCEDGFVLLTLIVSGFWQANRHNERIMAKLLNLRRVCPAQALSRDGGRLCDSIAESFMTFQIYGNVDTQTISLVWVPF